MYTCQVINWIIYISNDKIEKFVKSKVIWSCLPMNATMIAKMLHLRSPLILGQ